MGVGEGTVESILNHNTFKILWQIYEYLGNIYEILNKYNEKWQEIDEKTKK